MNNNFTKEYIKECDCEEIQELKLNFNLEDKYAYEMSGEYFHNFVDSYKTANIISAFNSRNKYIWLPTGDQLDEGIVKILKDKYQYYKWEYIVKCCWIGRSHTDWVCILYDENQKDMFTENDSNPLIAKIKLLKELSK